MLPPPQDFHLVFIYGSGKGSSDSGVSVKKIRIQVFRKIKFGDECFGEKTSMLFWSVASKNCLGWLSLTFDWGEKRKFLSQGTDKRKEKKRKKKVSFSFFNWTDILSVREIMSLFRLDYKLRNQRKMSKMWGWLMCRKCLTMKSTFNKSCNNSKVLLSFFW